MGSAQNLAVRILGAHNPYIPIQLVKYIPSNVSNNDFKTILLMLWHQSVDMRSRFVFDPTLHVGLPVDVQLLQMYKFGIFAEKSLLGFRGCSNTK